MSNKILNLDFSKDPMPPKIIYGRVGDDTMQTVTVNVTRRDEIADLTGGELRFEGVSYEAKTKVFDSENIDSTATGLKKGTFEYTFPSKAFSVAGKYQRAYFSFEKDGKRDTTADFEMIVLDTADLNTDEAEAVISEYNKLVEDLKQIQKETIDQLQKEQNEYLLDVSQSVKEIKAQIVTFENDISKLQTSINETVNQAQDAVNSTAKNAEREIAETVSAALSVLSDALEEFKAGDFYTKLEADTRFLRKFEESITSQNWNSVTSIGTYAVENATGANKAGTNGTLLVQGKSNNADTLTQLFVGTDAIVFRYKSYDSVWTNWTEVGKDLENVGEQLIREIDTDMAIRATFDVALEDSAVFIGSYIGQSAPLPSSEQWVQLTPSEIERIKTNDDQFLQYSTIPNDAPTAGIMVNINLIQAFKNKFGEDYFSKKGANDIPSQVAVIKTMFRSVITSKGYGSGYENRYSIRVYDYSQSYYEPQFNHREATPTELTAVLPLELADNVISDTGILSAKIDGVSATTVRGSELIINSVSIKMGYVASLKDELQKRIGGADFATQEEVNEGKAADKLVSPKTLAGFNKANIPLEVYISHKSTVVELDDVISGNKFPIGDIQSIDLFHTIDDLPFTLSSDKTTLTMKRDATLLIQQLQEGRGNSSASYTDYFYFYFNGGTTRYDGIKYGMDAGDTAINLSHTGMAQCVMNLKAGDVIWTSVSTRSTDRKLWRGSVRGTYIKEMKSV